MFSIAGAGALFIIRNSTTRNHTAVGEYELSDSPSVSNLEIRIFPWGKGKTVEEVMEMINL
jgi:hypothetical protein